MSHKSWILLQLSFSNDIGSVSVRFKQIIYRSQSPVKYDFHCVRYKEANKWITYLYLRSDELICYLFPDRYQLDIRIILHASVGNSVTEVEQLSKIWWLQLIRRTNVNSPAPCSRNHILCIPWGTSSTILLWRSWQISDWNSVGIFC